MIRLILQTQGRLEGFSVLSHLSHLLSPKVKSTLLSTNDLQCALWDTMAWSDILVVCISLEEENNGV